jgi:hypothetical protein
VPSDLRVRRAQCRDVDVVPVLAQELQYAVLTPEGVKAVRRSVRVVWSVRPGLFDERLTDTDVADLRRILGKLLRRLDVVD